MYRLLLLVAMFYAVGESVAADPQLLLYQVFVPQERFSPYYDGPDYPVSLALKTSEEWRNLWTKVEPRLSRDAGQRAAHRTSK
jgi:hypothetical protein